MFLKGCKGTLKEREARVCSDKFVLQFACLVIPELLCYLLYAKVVILSGDSEITKILRNCESPEMNN